MIENLSGIHETVNYKSNTHLRLYNNREHEDYPQHWHTPIEIIMPAINTYTVCLGEESILLAPGDILIICPGVIHSLHAPESGERMIFQADLSILQGLGEIESVLTLLSPAILLSTDSAPDIHEKIQTLLTQINDAYHDNAALSEASIYAALLSVFVLIGRNYTENTVRFDAGYHKHQEYTEKFIYICNYINEHCSENLTLDEIAERAGFSKFHFTRLFKQFTNITFYKYLNQKRIAKAELLLTDKSLSITEIALRSGFSSLSAFIRMFKIIKHCTPTDFRKMYAGMS